MSTTSDAVAVEVPDIGDFEDVPVIEILVSPGDSVAVDDPLLTLESDKATMDVPAPFAGTVGELMVKVGDKVSQGVKLLTLSRSGDNGGAESSADDGPRPSTGSATSSATPKAGWPRRWTCPPVGATGPRSCGWPTRCPNHCARSATR